jgi:CubicO group peptidase (beta-lactamase class C family)
VERGAVQERLARQLPEALGPGVPGIGVALLAGSDVVWTAAHGVADAATGTPLTPESVFAGASFSKPVFACAVLRLCEAGVLDLDRPLSDYLPGPYLPDEPRLPLITARHVLAHRTGFPNWRPRGGPLRLGAAPGARFGYSGEGYVYLQRVVEHVVGAPLQDVAAAQVLTPLGLARTSYVWRPDVARAAARGHRADGTPLEPERRTAGNAAYSLHTTPTDFARFAGALLAPGAAGLLRGPTVAALWAPQTRIDDGLAWGLGWGLQRHAAAGDGWSLWHWGDNPGYKHIALVGRAHGLVVMTNGDRGLPACRALVHAVTGDDAPLFAFLDAFPRHVVRVEPGEADR